MWWFSADFEITIIRIIIIVVIVIIIIIIIHADLTIIITSIAIVGFVQQPPPTRISKLCFHHPIMQF